MEDLKDWDPFKITHEEFKQKVKSVVMNIGVICIIKSYKGLLRC